jgi:hypothetical protein
MNASTMDRLMGDLKFSARSTARESPRPIQCDQDDDIHDTTRYDPPDCMGIHWTAEPIGDTHHRLVRTRFLANINDTNMDFMVGTKTGIQGGIKIPEGPEM